MPSTADDLPQGVILLGPGQGRSYDCGAIASVFKADGLETRNAYSISEWWLEPRTPPGAHCHEANDDLFYVLAGTLSLLIDQTWVDAEAGTFVRIPAGVRHDFANRTPHRAGLLNISIPGGFESDMPAIVEWFATHR